jgi:hypothetical protein
MRLVPKDKVGKIEFCESRLGKWAEYADEIGATPEMVALLADSTAEARAAFEEQQRAQSAAQAATLKLDNAIKKMQTQAATIVVYVRAKASVTGDRGVYSLASIPVPAKPSPIAAPGTPTGFSAKLEEATGALNLKWECKNPRGSSYTFYEISRQTDGGPFVRLARAGKRRFVDQTIPPGTARLVYQIQAVRSTGAGATARFSVNFGTSGRTIGMRMEQGMMAA